MCYENCPSADFNIEEMERTVFGRSRGELESEIGVHSDMYAVRAKNEDILEKCQDGGAVSAILFNFLSEAGDGAVVAGLEEGSIWVPKPLVVSSEKEVIEAAGTKYTSSPTLIGVASAIKENDKKKVAVVGTPCQMKALRKVETGDFNDAWIKDRVDLKLGLFCMETFSHPSLMEFLEKEGVEPSQVEKFEIKSGRFIAHQKDGETYRARLRKVKELVRPCCHGCDDFSSEFADIAIGNVGSPNGWSTVVVRTKKGEEALKAAEKNGLLEVKQIEEGKKGMGIILKLASMKRSQAQEHVKEASSSPEE
jgi:coenzyme F420 hydrogenase subunit beta